MGECQRRLSVLIYRHSSSDRIHFNPRRTHGINVSNVTEIHVSLPEFLQYILIVYRLGPQMLMPSQLCRSKDYHRTHASVSPFRIQIESELEKEEEWERTEHGEMIVV